MGLTGFIVGLLIFSSTVAIITAASIIQPLLPALGLDTKQENFYACCQWAQVL